MSANGNGKGGRFKLRKLALFVVVDEQDEDGEAMRLDVELGPFLATSPEKLAVMLEDDLPALLARLNEHGLEPSQGAS